MIYRTFITNSIIDLSIHSEEVSFSSLYRNSLGSHKRSFVPDLVPSLLDLSLIPVEDLRVAIIPLFYDMLQCEYRTPRSVHATEPQPMAMATVTRRDLHEHRRIHGTVAEFETTMVKSLDVYIEGGRGDADYVRLFEQLMQERCHQNVQLKDEGFRLVDSFVSTSFSAFNNLFIF